MKFRSPIDITRSVIFALVLREMRTRFGQRRMGAFWMIAEPLLHLIMFTVLMGILRNRADFHDIPYPVFLLVAVAPFILFRGICLLVMEGVNANRALFAYKQIMPLDTFIARALMQFCITSSVYILVTAGFAWYGFDMRISQPLEWMLTLAAGIAFSFGLGVILAIVTNAAPDVRNIIRMLFLPLYFISGVVYPPSHMSPAIIPYLTWNPYLHIIELLRTFVFPHYEPIPQTSPAYVFACTLAALFIGLGLYRVRKLKLLAITGV
ncbi:ABC transporter permease [Orrella sp. JC864]|uniref:ABC transporter permease n=1 Tax=Orrella sp. JC864 TaxID=3120298 RepID=UPI0030089C9C